MNKRQSPFLLFRPMNRLMGTLIEISLSVDLWTDSLFYWSAFAIDWCKVCSAKWLLSLIFGHEWEKKITSREKQIVKTSSWWFGLVLYLYGLLRLKANHLFKKKVGERMRERERLWREGERERKRRAQSPKLDVRTGALRSWSGCSSSSCSPPSSTLLLSLLYFFLWTVHSCNVWPAGGLFFLLLLNFLSPFQCTHP